MGRLSLKATDLSSRAAYICLLLDFASSLTFLLVQGVQDPLDYFQLGSNIDLSRTVFDVNLICLVRCALLPLLFWQANELGTMYAEGRDGRSAAHTTVTRALLLIVPLASLGYAIFKATIINPLEATGPYGVVLASIVCAVAFPVFECSFSYWSFVRVRQSGPDYNYLLEDTIYDEETPLLARPRKSSHGKLPGLIGELGETSVGAGTQTRGPVTTATQGGAASSAAAGVSGRETGRTTRKAKETRRARRKTTHRNPGDLPGPRPSPRPKMPQLPKPHEDESPEEKMHRARSQIVAEIVDTEERYVETLAMIIRVFLLPLRRDAEAGRSRRTSLSKRSSALISSSPGTTTASATIGSGSELSEAEETPVVIERGHVKSIFLEIETIYKVNSLLLDDLRVRFSEWGPDTKIADVFLAIMSYFKTYTQFANNFDNAIQTIGLCKRQPSFAEFLSDALNNPDCRKMWLDDHLIVPIQRIPRYILLMQSLLKKTRPNHPDHDDLCTLLDQLETLATHINNSKREAEKSLMMISIQRMVKRCPNIVTPTRIFINDFPCVEIAPISHAEHSATADLETSTEPTPLSERRFAQVGPVVLYLFNDMLMVAAHEQVQDLLGRATEAFKSVTGRDQVVRPTTVDEERGGEKTLHKFKFQRLVMMEDVTVLDCSEDVENGFIVRFPRGSVYFESPSLEEKRFFMKTFSEVKARHRDDMKMSGPVLHAKRSLRKEQEAAAASISRADKANRVGGGGGGRDGGGDESLPLKPVRTGAGAEESVATAASSSEARSDEAKTTATATATATAAATSGGSVGVTSAGATASPESADGGYIHVVDGTITPAGGNSPPAKGGGGKATSAVSTV
eukprot:UC1_evm1s1655